MTAPRLIHGLALLVPVAGWLDRTGAGPVPIFIVSCLAILPLAGLMGEATEQLAERRARPRRAAQRDVRQRRRADHRLHGAARGRDRDRQGLAHRIDPRQPAHGARAGDARRRLAAQGADVQPPRRRERRQHDGAGGGGAGDPGHLRAGHPAQQPGAHRVAQPRHLVRADRHLRGQPVFQFRTHRRLVAPAAAAAGGGATSTTKS